jgi:carboxymethylenebutenolidase
MYHYGAQDKSIPPEDVEKARAAAQAPELVFVYEGAGHGFNCDQRDSYQPQAAALARTRTLEFLDRHVAGKPAADG